MFFYELIIGNYLLKKQCNNFLFEILQRYLIIIKFKFCKKFEVRDILFIQWVYMYFDKVNKYLFSKVKSNDLKNVVLNVVDCLI